MSPKDFVKTTDRQGRNKPTQEAVFFEYAQIEGAWQSLEKPPTQVKLEIHKKIQQMET